MRCKFFDEYGTRCSNKAKKDSIYCRIHDKLVKNSVEDEKQKRIRSNEEKGLKNISPAKK